MEQLHVCCKVAVDGKGERDYTGDVYNTAVEMMLMCRKLIISSQQIILSRTIR